MIRKVFFGISIIASVFLSLFIMMFVLKETDQEKFLCGYMILGLCFFGLSIWAYEWARVRDERKKRIERRKQNEIRETKTRRD